VKEGLAIEREGMEKKIQESVTCKTTTPTRVQHEKTTK